MPGRKQPAVKIKNYHDMEGIIIGFQAGRNGKDGKQLGKIGSIILDIGDEKELKLAKLPLSVCKFEEEYQNWALLNPGERRDDINGITFKRGMLLTFSYNQVTKDGIPECAVFKEIKYEG